MKKLQALKDGKWQYVFCWVENRGNICFTDNRKKALYYHEDNVKYFRNKAGYLEYRGI